MHQGPGVTCSSRGGPAEAMGHNLLLTGHTFAGAPASPSQPSLVHGEAKQDHTWPVVGFWGWVWICSAVGAATSSPSGFLPPSVESAELQLRYINDLQHPGNQPTVSPAFPLSKPLQGGLNVQTKDQSPVAWSSRCLLNRLVSQMPPPMAWSSRCLLQRLGLLDAFSTPAPGFPPHPTHAACSPHP